MRIGVKRYWYWPAMEPFLLIYATV